MRRLPVRGGITALLECNGGECSRYTSTADAGSRDGRLVSIFPSLAIGSVRPAAQNASLTALCRLSTVSSAQPSSSIDDSQYADLLIGSEGPCPGLAIGGGDIFVGGAVPFAVGKVGIDTSLRAKRLLLHQWRIHSPRTGQNHLDDA